MQRPDFIPCAITRADLNKVVAILGPHHPRAKPSTASHHDTLCAWVRSLFPADLPCLRDYVFEAVLGRGAFGVTLGARSRADRGKLLAIKVQLYDEADNEMEVAMQRIYGSHNLAPKIYDSCVYRPSLAEGGSPLLIIVMDRIRGNLHEYIYKRTFEIESDAERMAFALDIIAQLRALADRMQALRLSHNDLHPGNVSIVDDPTNRASGVKLGVIDFGFAANTYSTTPLMCSVLMCYIMDLSGYIRNVTTGSKVVALTHHLPMVKAMRNAALPWVRNVAARPLQAFRDCDGFHDVQDNMTKTFRLWATRLEALDFAKVANDVVYATREYNELFALGHTDMHNWLQGLTRYAPRMRRLAPPVVPTPAAPPAGNVFADMPAAPINAATAAGAQRLKRPAPDDVRRQERPDDKPIAPAEQRIEDAIYAAPQAPAAVGAGLAKRMRYDAARPALDLAAQRARVAPTDVHTMGIARNRPPAEPVRPTSEITPEDLYKRMLWFLMHRRTSRPAASKDGICHLADVAKAPPSLLFRWEIQANRNDSIPKQGPLAFQYTFGSEPQLTMTNAQTLSVLGDETECGAKNRYIPVRATLRMEVRDSTTNALLDIIDRNTVVIMTRKSKHVGVAWFDPSLDPTIAEMLTTQMSAAMKRALKSPLSMLTIIERAAVERRDTAAATLYKDDGATVVALKRAALDSQWIAFDATIYASLMLLYLVEKGSGKHPTVLAGELVQGETSVNVAAQVGKFTAALMAQSE
ncbi:Ser/Thr protein kinase [Medusavirus stheno T3]|uniref:Ser/Thr protein kinase n=1 Tax=Medusavirus stheno T3 TaxID=3069717 RepID=A0A7S8BDM0_9VIRU|nr:Ser/Thr protein kinase [Acanthamoeba castellanii medusavirus]QPB44329.1 Ser/Thr protein kinase [Medusavirus stheno T3]